MMRSAGQSTIKLLMTTLAFLMPFSWAQSTTYSSDITFLQISSSSTPNLTSQFYTKNNKNILEFHAEISLQNYNVQGWSTDRGIWAVFGINADTTGAFYDGVQCRISSVTFSTSKDLTGMSCFDVYFNKTTYQMYTDTTNNVVNDLSASSTTYSSVGGVSYLTLNQQFYRYFDNDATIQDYNLTDGQRGFNVFFAYGNLKSGVIQESSTHILNTKITKSIDLLPVGTSSFANVLILSRLTFGITFISILLNIALFL
eukprot:403340175